LPEQPVFTLDPEEEVARAVEAGLALCRSISAPSHQPQNAVADITWTWLVFEKEAMR
jgi:hypothetical protein